MSAYESRASQLLKALRSQAFYNKLGLAALRIIKDRTRKGRDVEGKIFMPYSDPYAASREKRGLNTHPVNLSFQDLTRMLPKGYKSSQQGMLNSIDHVVANDFTSVSILINDPVKEQIAVYHNVQGAGKGKVIRRFWGIEAAKEIKQLADLGYKTLVDLIKRF
jgi:hypothetical protein